jgi:hypothetical protein
MSGAPDKKEGYPMSPLTPAERAAFEAERRRERERDELAMAMQRHPSLWTPPADGALPAGLAERAWRTAVREAHNAEQVELIRADLEPRPSVPIIPDYPSDLPLPSQWVRTRWDVAWLANVGQGVNW